MSVNQARLPLADGEVRHGLQVFAVNGDGGVEDGEVGPATARMPSLMPVTQGMVRP